MRIGYLSLGACANLLDTNQFDLGWGVRVPVIKSFIEQDIDVIMLSSMSKVDETYKRYRTLRKPPEWFNKIEYRYKTDFTKTDLEDLDILFIECGTTNTMFGRDGVSYFSVVTNALKEWEGRVVYYQHSPVLYYPFGEWFNDEPIDNVSENNLRRQVKKAKVFENKEWIIVHHAMNEDVWIDGMYCRHGMTYRDILERVGDQLKFKYIPLPYDLREEKRYGSATGKRWDTIFVGGRYSSSSTNYAKKKTDRYLTLVRLFKGGNFRYAVIGRFWDDVKDLNTLGTIGKPYEVTKLYNQSLVSVWTDSELVRETGFWITRYIFILMGGCLLLADKEHELATKYVDKEYWVYDKNDLGEIIDWYRDLSNDDKEEIRIKQENKFPRWNDIDWKSIFRI